MRRIRIFAHEVALVYYKGELERVLTKGVYWIMPFRTIQRHTMSGRFITDKDINMLLENEIMWSLLNVVEVSDNELALHYFDGNFQAALGPGKYAFWKGLELDRFDIINLMDIEVPATISQKLLNQHPLSAYALKVKVEAYEKGVLYVDGKFDRLLEAGTTYFWRAIKQIEVQKVDLRTQVLEVNGQEILTKDKAALRVNIFAQYELREVYKAIVETKEYIKQMYAILQLAFRSFIGTYTLDELLARKDEVGNYLTETLKDQFRALGVKVTNCGIKDIILPGEVKDIMNQVLVAEKRAQANVITRREETASTRSLLNTAKLMEDNDMLYRLKEMEYMEKIAEKVNGITLSGGTKVLEQLGDLFVGKNR